MPQRPPKLTPPTVLVIWGARELTLAEKVVWYRDWSLDDGVGPDGCYAGPSALAKGLGGSLTPGSISTIRQRLKRLGLHAALDRGPGANCGWIATVPTGDYRARTAKEAQTISPLLDQHIRNHDRGLVAVESETATPPPLEHQFHGERNEDSTRSAAALGGRRGGFSSESVRQAQLTSRVREKGVIADAPELQKREERDRATVEAEGLAHIRAQRNSAASEPNRIEKSRRRGEQITAEWLANDKLKKGQSLNQQEQRDANSYRLRLQAREETGT